MWEEIPPLSSLGPRTKTRTVLYGTPSIEPGTNIRNYNLGKRIGIGGFGEVYRATNITLRREVAIKVYRVHHDENVLRAFARGASLLAQIRHPNVIIVHDFFVFDSHAYMVMELMEPATTLRQSVAKFVSEKGITQFVPLFSTLVQVLRYCHNARFRGEDGTECVGVYHGDIKPDNIFMRDGQPILSDFMIPNVEQFLKAHGGECFPMDDTRAYGTPMYMSPEQFSGRVSEQSDIYNLGVTAFEVLTGFYPYESEEDFREHVSQPIERFNPYCPDWLTQVVNRAISHDLNVRYRHAAEIEIELAKHNQADLKYSLPPRRGATEQRQQASARSSSLWSEGLFFVLLLTVVFGLVLGLAVWTPAPLVIAALIGALLLFGTVGVFVLRRQGDISEKGFVAIIRGTLSQLRLLNASSSSRARSKRNSGGRS